MRLVVGLWAYRGNLERAKQRIACDERTRLDTRIGQVVNQLEQITQPIVAGAAPDRKSEFRSGKSEPSKSEI